MPRYLATKEGWDGRRIIKSGTVFNYDGPRGSWMVPCDENGKPIKGESAPPEQRPLRAGAKQTTGLNREALRARCKELGIKFAATLGAPALAELIQKHEEEVEGNSVKAPSPENSDGGAPGVGGEGGGEPVAPPAPSGGTGNIEVL